MKFILSLCLILAFSLSMESSAEKGFRTKKKKISNKLLQMYRLYYLPFSIYFREGNSKNEIVPFVNADPGGLTKRMLKAQELQALNKDWDGIRKSWKGRSLFLTTPVRTNKSVRITRSLYSHRISLTRRAFDGIQLNDRIKMNKTLKSKPPLLQNAFKQLRFMKSFIGRGDERKFNLFIVSASWCQSCLEYRVLLETYVKKFPNANLVLHSIVVEDPKEEIFDAKVMSELFPNPKKYSHESIPRFLTLQTIKGKPVVHQEGEAIKTYYDKFLLKHRGYLDNKTSIFGQSKRGISSKKR